MLSLDEAWNSYLSTRDLSYSNYYRDQNRYTNHLQQYWHGKKLESIKTADIIAYRQHLLNKGLNGQTVKLCLSQLRKTMRRAKMFGIYNGEIPYFEMPKVDSVRYRYLEKIEAKMLMSELKGLSELWHCIAVLALNTGMRAGEIFSLRGENINFFQKTIILGNSKSGKQRFIPLNETAYKILLENKKEKDSLIFHQVANPKVPFLKVSKVYRKAVANCGLNFGITDNRNKVVFHTLRHTFASWLVQEGVPIYIVSDLLGHGSVKITERYAHLAPNQGRDAVNLIKNYVKV